MLCAIEALIGAAREPSDLRRDERIVACQSQRDVERLVIEHRLELLAAADGNHAPMVRFMASAIGPKMNRALCHCAALRRLRPAPASPAP